VTTAQQGWDYGAGIATLDVDDNASGQADTVYVKGNGYSYGTPFGKATDTTLPAAGYPALDGVDTNNTSDGDLTRLTSVAAGALKLVGRPVETWTAMVRVDGRTTADRVGGPSLGQWSAGDAVQIGVQRHPYIVNGDYQRRALGASNGPSADTAMLRLAPTVGAV
jgi:hypothetical protein